MIPETIYLSDTTKEEIEQLANKIVSSKKKEVMDSTSGWHKGNSDRSYPVKIGLSGEYAYASVSNTEVNKTVYKSKGDIIDFFGCVEIKSFTSRTGNPPDLLVKRVPTMRRSPKSRSDYDKMKEISATKEVYIVVAWVNVEDFSVKLIGHITFSEFDKMKIGGDEIHFALSHNWFLPNKLLRKTIPIMVNGEIKLVPIE